MGNYGIKISQDGFNVKTCNDKDLVMTSKLDLLKTALTGTYTGQVAHGLSYTPIFFTIRQKASGQYSFIGDDNAYVDSTYLIVYGGYSSSNSRYYIFYQAAT